MNYSDIYAVCYNALNVFKTKEDAKKFYSSCYYMSEGAEHERYASILVDLNFSNLGKDNASSYCREISIKSNDDKFVTIELEKKLSIDDTVKYYEEKVKPILEVSAEYNVDFSSKIPFEYFATDSDSYTNISFTDYYKKLCEKFNINVDSIFTNEKSDGKYELLINNEKFDITAWDSLESVIDNINSMLNLSKEKIDDSNMEI